MVQSSVYPGLERKPGGPDNWVEAAGGLPSYIERIAKHLHYEEGYSISRAIAVAVNTVKRWARGGTVTKSGTTKRITPATQAKAAAALAEWEAKKARKINLSNDWMKPQKCNYCTNSATKGVLHSEGKAYVSCCDSHLSKAKVAAAASVPSGKPDPGNIDGIYDLKTKKRLDLADGNIDATSTMVAFMLEPGLASKLAIPNGVKPEDMHVTLTFHGEVEEDGDYDEIVRMVTECVQEYGEPLSGQIGGIGSFPPGDEGVPWYIPVDILGLNRLQLKLVEHFRGSSWPASEDHGYNPHVTLTYGDTDMPVDKPIERQSVKFGSVWVARGNEQRTEIPLGDDDGVGKPSDGTLSSSNDRPREAKVELSALVERARSISDTEQKLRVRQRIIELANIPTSTRKKLASEGKAMPHGGFPIRNAQDLRNAIQAFGRAKDPAAAKRHIIKRARALGMTSILPQKWKVDLANDIIDGVIDLAMTKDGRKSFKNQGKWKHGFIPVDEEAKTSKAKGSPIAMKRINRLYGDGVVVKGKRGGTVRATSAARLGGAAQTKNARATQRVRPQVKREVSRGRGSTARALKPWENIPDEAKTIRNGKRFVVSTFAGKQQLTEWSGPQGYHKIELDPSRVVYRTMTLAKAKKFSSAELRRLLSVPGQPKAVKKVINQAMKSAAEREKTSV